MLSDNFVTILFQNLVSNSVLTRLYLHYGHISALGSVAIGEYLRKNTTLTCLSMSINSIGDEGVKILSHSLSSNSSLLELNLKGNSLSDKSGEYFAQLMKDNHTLTALWLYDNKIGDGCITLCTALRDNHSLRTLYLRHNEIGEKGGLAIASLLTVNKTLETLYINDNKKINGEVQKEIALVLRDHCFLLQFYWDGCLADWLDLPQHLKHNQRKDRFSDFDFEEPFLDYLRHKAKVSCRDSGRSDRR